MTVCQYFLQGRCRFGQNCRNEHLYASDDRNTRNPLNSQQLNTIVKIVAETVILAEKGGQWPLSCFSPLKGANIPGWEDYSPEEIRWMMYEARANGTLNQATLKINQLYSNAEKLRNVIKEPTMERVNIIANLLKGINEPPNTSNPFTSLSSSSSNIFGGSTQSSVSTGSQNIFGITSSPGNQGSIFGGTPTTTGNQGSIFGGTPTTTGNQGSIFGGSPPTTGNQGNIFGGSSQSSGNIFGAAGSFCKQNVFGNSMSSNAFSQNSQNAAASAGGSGNIFGNTTISSQSIFSNTGKGNNQQVSNPFLPQNSSGIFSKPSAPSVSDSKKSENLDQNQSFSFSSSQSENIFKSDKSFGKTDIFNPQSNSARSAFGSLNQHNSFGSNQQILNEFDVSIYSKLEDLNEEEIKSFTSATFVFGKIPLKPPPQSFCK